ncbi:MAG: hypothetical protein ABIF77_10510 [bacterium]
MLPLLREPPEDDRPEDPPLDEDLLPLLDFDDDLGRTEDDEDELLLPDCLRVGVT